ncbi:MAG TPA: transposase [Rhodanobacteraceae bacterium]|nr:transposase [Rhodanobacteraceae bacterium]
MSDYRRAWIPGGCFFFTVVTRNREPWLAGVDAMDRLRRAFREIMRERPFAIDAIVILPDHLHAIWRLPQGDADFSTRWRLIKHSVSVAPHRKWHWQPRFWEHVVREEDDWRRHVEYIHYNPVKHGYAPDAMGMAAQQLSPRHEARMAFQRLGATEPSDLPAETGE